MVATPCQSRWSMQNPAWLAPGAAKRHEVDLAKGLCVSCPQRAVCAAAALYSGESLDGRKSPATDVIQAGIHCRGDQTTADALAVIAGVDPPTYGKKKRLRPPSHCRSCRRPMVSWTRGSVPEGKVMHRGRGICENCRSAYALELATHHDGPGIITRLRPHEVPSHCVNCGLVMLRGKSRRPGVAEVIHDSKGKCTKCQRLRHAIKARRRRWVAGVIALAVVLAEEDLAEEDLAETMMDAA